MTSLFGRDDIIELPDLACDGNCHSWEDRFDNGVEYKQCRWCGINLAGSIQCDHEWSDPVNFTPAGEVIRRCTKCYLRKLEDPPCEHRWVSLYEEDGGAKGFAAYIGRICQYCKERQNEGGRYA